MEIRTRNDEWDYRRPASCTHITYGMQTTSTGFDSPEAAYAESELSFGSIGKHGDKVMHDVCVRNFKSRSRRGEIINNPMNKVINEYESTPLTRDCECYRKITYNFQDFYWKHGERYYGPYGANHILGYPELAGTWTLPEPLVDEMHYQQLAITQAYANIDTSEVQALVTAGEFRESIEFILSASKRLIRIYRNIRKLKFRALRNEITPKELSKRYLEYRYALRPMVGEIDSYFQAIVSTSRAVRQTFRGRQRLSVSELGDEVVVIDNHFGKTYAREKISVDFTARAGVLCSIDVDNLDRWGFTKVVDSAWELIPFSFIADWFFNIGQTVASFTPEMGVKELASWYSVAKVVTREKFVTRSTVGAPFNLCIGGGCGIMTNISNYWSPAFVRHKKTSYMRSPNLERSLLPTWNIRLDGWKLLDIGLILKQLAS